jgi:glycosyltransferase involved in cell wall biosynthesis
MFKVSVLTVAFNSAQTIEDTIKSVLGQKGDFTLEYIIVDGNSADGTLQILKKYKTLTWVSESDQGIYDAMNKGLKLATGDIVGILNADDVYANDTVLQEVVSRFQNSKINCLYGDLMYVAPHNLQKVIRYWQAGEFKPGSFQTGWMPPHPSFFVRREVYKKYGLFDLNFPLAADYEIMLRFLEKHRLESLYLPKVLVKMRLGGASNRNLKNLLRNYGENYQAWTNNGLKLPWYTLILKRLRKLPQFFAKVPNL